MDLLVMSLKAAKQIMPCWGAAELTGGVCFIIGFFVAVFTSVFFVLCVSDLLNKKVSKHGKKAAIEMIALCLPVLTICALVIAGQFAENTGQGSNEAAVNDIKYYHQIKHLKKIYPKLPCNSSLKKRCAKSLTSTTRDKEMVKHGMTKEDAAKRYLKLKHVYHRSKEKVNGKHPLYPRKPHWYEYV